jgi:hypothetical protein
VQLIETLVLRQLTIKPKASLLPLWTEPLP